MIGGEGNDFYYVDNVGDIVKELADQGKDRVYADISYTLPSHVEELFLTGSAESERHRQRPQQLHLRQQRRQHPQGRGRR